MNDAGVGHAQEQTRPQGQKVPRGRGRAVKARKDAEGQEKVIELGELRERLPELESLYRSLAGAREEYSEAVKAAAEASGLVAAAIRRYLAGRFGRNFPQAKRVAEQMQLCFEEIGA